MKKVLTTELFEKFEHVCYLLEGVECWSAREMHEILGYFKWDNFINVIEKSKNACETAGEMITDHFAVSGKW